MFDEVFFFYGTKLICLVLLQIYIRIISLSPSFFTAEKAPVPSLFEQKAAASSFDQQQPVKVVYYRALYPFDARSHDEISITPGDVIMVCSVYSQM